ncbi:anthranilate phosphoribosyltransferase [Buchnera aphidicola]|uniref:Anthranilate phosphoribosyltransferase n=1 Tax=Buchnera aphidicola (Aphis gossypii) TaxID=98785 RepID=A0A5J6ZD54_9GAMM|nr:anthranilate phosphoribosyltransferase [Buchnera aphidicola]QFQ32111.1 anthranilate phosphoribosyltransferase [Buchnera aphidicola (Aphis gossypii)]UPT14638.1 anthranilate phosphoribosyltransferase [Buchnera aphidicola (Aphis gossypii)]
MQHIFKKLYKLESLDQEESYRLFNSIISGKINEIQLSSILTAMHVRHESIEEILGAIGACLKAMKFFPRPNYIFADIVGTGGDSKNTINISTASAFTASHLGFKIIKHCNKGVSSKSGSSDILKKFKINLNPSIQSSLKTLDQLNICFLFAPKYHDGFQYVSKIRKTLKIKTIFNLLGPFLNPSRPFFTVIGVYKKDLINPMVEILKKLKYQRGIIIHSDGTDEVTLNGITYVSELLNKKIHSYQLEAKDFGLKEHIKPIHAVSSQEESYNIIKKTLQGKGDRLYEELIAVNVAILLKIFGYEDLKKNTKMVLNKIRSGEIYKHIIKISNMLKEDEYGRNNTK